MSSDLADFLLARFAEDEALARREPDVYARWNGAESEEALTDVADIPPGRLLAECEAKRGVLGVLALAEDQFQKTHLGAADYADVARARITLDALIWVARHLALPYAGHPDYREEWRP